LKREKKKKKEKEVVTERARYGWKGTRGKRTAVVCSVGRSKVLPRGHPVREAFFSSSFFKNIYL
jgi:hypothetical protein